MAVIQVRRTQVEVGKPWQAATFPEKFIRDKYDLVFAATGWLIWMVIVNKNIDQSVKFSALVLYV
jgi:hypothetical protein